MLNFDKILPVIDRMVDKKLKLEREKPNVLTEAIEILKTIEANLYSEDDFSSVSYFVGTPVERADTKVKEEVFDSEYMAIATDGSAIAPNPDFALNYYLINIGYVVIGYGKNHFFEADSVPELFYDETDLYETIGGNPYLVKGELLQAKMLLEESKILSKKIEEKVDFEIPMISLIDGTLIQWEIKGRDEEYKKHFVRSFESLFKKAEELGVPVAGYISGSHSKDVVGLIKYHLRKNGAVLEELKKFDILNDTEIFENFITYGQRSAIFLSHIPILKYYDAPVYFFYLNTGSEVVRIEIPHFVIGGNKSFTKVSQIQKLILSQAKKGKGYPVVLREAHEQAVIRNGDKFALENLLREKLADEGIEFTGDRKAFFKRTRVI